MIMRKSYDFIFGLGNACSCTQTLRQAGLQYLSFPFDWVVMGGEHDLEHRVSFIENGFRGWFEQKDLVKVRSYAEGNKDIYRNTATDTIFNHEFKIGDDLAERFPAVRAKYDRRIVRFLSLLKSSKTILVLRMDRPDQDIPTSPDECHQALSRLRTLYPQAEFDMILLSMADGIAFADRRVDDLGDGLTRIAFDYRDTKPGVPPFAVRFADTSAALAEMATVRDYRTHAERKSFIAAQRRKRWAKYGASSLWEYLLARIGIGRSGAVIRKRKYDFIIGFGNACTCSQTLRHAGLQFLSLPFDWIVFNLEEGDLRKRADFFDNDFADWFRQEDLEFKAHGELRHKTDIYLNVRTRVVFNHDFPQNVPFESAYPEVLAKYRRRIDRMYRLFRSSKRVLVLRLDRPNQSIPTSVEDCRYLRAKLAAKFPGVEFDVLLFNHVDGRPFESARMEHLPGGIMRIAFDYRSRDPNAMPTDIEIGPPSRILRKNFRVRDYRTREDKLAFKRSSQE